METGNRLPGVFLFGMTPERGRWILVLLGMTINLCLGTLYSWSVFVDPLIDHFSSEMGITVTANEVLMPFSMFIAVFAVTMLLTGRYIERLPPGLVTVAGGILAGAGWFAASLATSPGALTVIFGVIGGIGVGIAYGATIAVAARWFPDRRGLAVGMTVLGVGFSALLTANLAGYLIVAHGVMTTFLIFGVGIILITVPMGLPLRFPPRGWRPAGWTPPLAGEAGHVACECDRRAMLRTPAFYGLWTCYFIGSIAGLMAVSIAKPVGTSLVSLDSGIATTLVGFFAVFNGCGRPVFGVISDRLSPGKAARLSFLLIGIASFVMWRWPSLLTYLFAFATLWGCLGGWLALAPTATASYFGTSDYPRCYGLVFLAYGAGAIGGPQLAGFVMNATGSYLGVFPAVFLLSIAGFLIASILMKPPGREDSPATEPGPS